MRQFQFRVRPPGDGLNSVGRAVAAAPTLRRKALLWLNLLRDGTAIAVYELAGDPVAVEAHVQESDVHDAAVFDRGEDRCGLYVVFDPDDDVEAMLAIHDRYPLVFDLPITFTDDGALQLTVASVQRIAQQAFDEVPSSVDVRLEHVAGYGVERPDLRAHLTDRQLEVLSTALEMGYYEVPSAVTQDDIAGVLECSAATVSTHLKKAEAALVRGVLSGDR